MPARNAHDHRFQCVSLVPIFAGLPEEARHQIAAVARTRHYDRQELVHVPGDEVGLHIVHGGQVKTYRLTESGGEQLIRLLGPGDFLGETALLTETQASDFAMALRPSEVCSISRADMTELLRTHADVTLAMLERVAGRLHDAESQLSSMSGLSVAERLARHLLELAESAGSTSVQLRSTKKDLASYLGTSPETLSRRLSAFEDQGLVRIGPGRAIEVLDPDGLRGVS